MQAGCTCRIDDTTDYGRENTANAGSPEADTVNEWQYGEHRTDRIGSHFFGHRAGPGCNGSHWAHGAECEVELAAVGRIAERYLHAEIDEPTGDTFVEFQEQDEKPREPSGDSASSGVALFDPSAVAPEQPGESAKLSLIHI